MQDSFLSLDKITKTYNKQIVLNEVSFSLERGDIVGLVGPNGSGKTTLMSIVVGLIKNYKGNVLIAGNDIRKKEHLVRRRIGCVIESPGFYPDMTGFENLKFFSQVFGGIDNNDINEIVNLLDLDNSIHKKVKKYSLGMKQRLGLAQAVLGYPEIVILDEPTNGLDPNIIPSIRSFIKKVAKERKVTFLISSHILTEIEAICKRVIFINNGRVIKDINISGEEIENSNFYVIETNKLHDMQNYLNTLGIQFKTPDDEKVIVNMTEDMLEQLISKLMQNGITIKAFYIQKTTLEEKFMKSIGANAIE